MMLQLGALLTAVAVTSSFALPQPQDQGEDRVANLVLAGVGYLKNSFKNDPKIVSPDPNVDTSVAAAIGLAPSRPITSRFPLNTTNLRFYGTSKMETTIVKTDPKALTAQIQIKFPEIKLNGNYQIDGQLVNQQKLKGEGEFEIKYFNATWNVNNLQLFETETKALRIQSLGLSIDMGDISVVTKGLMVENTTVPEVEERVRQTMLVRFKSSQGPYSKGYERAFIDTWNRRIENRTLEECTRWLKEKASSDENRQ